MWDNRAQEVRHRNSIWCGLLLLITDLGTLPSLSWLTSALWLNTDLDSVTVTCISPGLPPSSTSCFGNESPPSMVILSGLHALLTGEMEAGCYASGCLDMELETLCPKTVHLSVLRIPRQSWPYERKSSGNPAGSALVSFYLLLSALRCFCFHLCSFAHLMFGSIRLTAFIRVCSPLWYPRME